MSRKGKGTPTIYIVLFKVFVALLLSVLVTSFSIWKSIVIFNMTGNKRPIDNKRTMKLIDTEESVDTKGLADAERLVDAKELTDKEKQADAKELINVEEPTDAEELVDAKKLVIIYY